MKIVNTGSKKLGVSGCLKLRAQQSCNTLCYAGYACCTAPDARIHAVAARALSARLDVVSAVGFQAALGVV